MSSMVILTPVLSRPANAARVVESLRQSGADARLLFLCSLGDQGEIHACRATGAEVVIVDWQPGPGDYAKKTQLGFDLSSEPFVFQGADDIIFQPGWAELALAEIERTQAGICGTNDDGNPMVKRGLHSTHSLIRRDYIMELGGTFDERPGDVLCLEYDHQCIDVELCELAKARGLFAFARDSIVKHLHPLWGHGQMDSTYTKALRHGQKDRALYMQRRRTWQRRSTRQ